jgi:hypothetical protein
MRGLSLILLCIAFATVAFAEEPRWCSVSSRDSSNTLAYAPIAAAAQVQGEARARIIYRPNGRAEKVEPVSGVPMLLIPLTDQLSKWTIRSKASGDELCQTLVIATFTLRDPPGKGKSRIKFSKEPNTVRIFLSRPRPIVEEVQGAIAAR